MIALWVQVALASPQSPEQEQAAFRPAEGFVVELVSAEPDHAKIVDLAFDDSGRMWAITASEYPLDGNESANASELFRSGGRDAVLVFDTPTRAGRQVPRVFADGLAMPMAILPWRDGALVGHGPEILLLCDGDGDGRAESRAVVLSGFGLEDSHLLPHRFVRGPDDWIWVAQGAFNYSKVRTRGGEVVPFDQCKLARFKPDGSRFEVLGFGLNNIWGVVLARSGELWIQEANDLGYPLVPFFEFASYPGIGDHRHRPYSPWQPALAGFAMGGTGMSGLARSEDRGAFPAPWRDAFFVANPIVNSVQAIATRRVSDVDQLERLADLLASDDTWFRPVAVHVGPDGCLYVVDWYNEVISHNEVPRTDPRRDKVQSRIWRIRHSTQARREPADIAALASRELVGRLSADLTWEARAAWHQIVDRGARELAPALETLARDREALTDARVLALWALEGLGAHDLPLLHALLDDAAPALRREALRASRTARGSEPERFALLARAPIDDVLRVRLAAVRELGHQASSSANLDAARELLVRTPAPRRPTSPAEIYVEFERSLIRAAWEFVPSSVRELVLREGRDPRCSEGRALCALAIAGARGAVELVEALGGLDREVTGEELSLLGRELQVAPARELFERLLADDAQRARVIDELVRTGEQVDAPSLAARLAEVLARDVARSPQAEAKDRLIRAATTLRLVELRESLARIAADDSEERARRGRALSALLELGGAPIECCLELARSSLPGEESQRVAVLGLARARNAAAVSGLAELQRGLPPVLLRAALSEIAADDGGARALLAGLADGRLDDRQLDERLVSRLRLAAQGAHGIADLEGRLNSRAVDVLRLDGGADACLDTDLELAGAFTVEAWVRLDDPITNADGILGVPGGADFNFADRRFRLWTGPEVGDVVIARRATEPGVWTHVAVARDESGVVTLFQDGELDARGARPAPAAFAGLDVGRTTPGEGTRGEIAEWRLWNRALSAAEIGAWHRRAFADGEEPAGLVRRIAAAADMRPLSGSARVERSFDGPPLVDAVRAGELERRFERARTLASALGDSQRGRAVFERTCQACHAVAGMGGGIGPTLDGAALRGIEGLLRAIVTPSAAIESGYRLLVVETRAGERLEGFLASQDERSIVLRRQDREDLRLERSEIEASAFERVSVMPEGLLEGLADGDVADLFAHLATLR